MSVKLHGDTGSVSSLIMLANAWIRIKEPRHPGESLPNT